MRNRTPSNMRTSTMSDCFEARNRRRDPPADAATYNSDSEDSCRSAIPTHSLARRLIGPGTSPKGKKMIIFSCPMSNDDEHDDKNHSPVAKRFVLRRLSESRNALTSSDRRCFSRKFRFFAFIFTIIMVLFGALSIGRITSIDEHGQQYLRFSRSKGWKPKQSLSSWPVPQAVVLPGPHMAETTAIQMCMVKWTTKEDRLLDDWLWTVPESSMFKKHNLISQGAVKDFSPLFGLLSGQRAFVFQQSHLAVSQHAMKIYKAPMLEAWRSGNRIVYGSEEMDFATSDIESVDPDKIMDGVLGILPWDDKSRKLEKHDVEAVVLHKGNRVDHLIEIWQEIELDGGSFRKFLSERGDIFSTIDGLGLAKLYLQRDIRVSIVDVSGMEEQSDTTICHVVSCVVLGVPCHGNAIVDSISIDNDCSRGFHKIQAKSQKKTDLSQEEIRKIDDILIGYDCSLRVAMQRHESILRILYQKDLFTNCPDVDIPERPFSWVVDQIQGVIGPSKEAADSRGTYSEIPVSLSDTWNPPEVVILPGPHGFSSTNLQSCFSKWSSKDSLIGDWKWAAPNATALASVNLRSLGLNKAFAPLYAMLSGQKSFLLENDEAFDLQKALDVYRAPMAEAWENGKKLVYGSEEMDWGVSMVETIDRSAIMDGVFNILPWNIDGSRILEKRSIAAVIPYDSNRVEHLRTIWQGAARVTRTSFRHFLAERSNIYSTTNALGLAIEYLDRGISTVLVDMSGVSRLDPEINECHVVACEVMEVSCDHNKPSIKDNITSQELVNAQHVKSTGIDPASHELTEQQLALIDAVMTEYDCGFKEIMWKHETTGLLRVLHRAKLFEGCPDPSPRHRFSWMVREIQKVVNIADRNNKTIKG